jgi:DUF971 family protein
VSSPWPTELRLQKGRKTLAVTFDNEESFELPAEYLRVRSPSAEVQGHSPAELGQNRERYWRDYLDELEDKKLTRTPAGR